MTYTSVIIATYNRATLLHRQLGCLARQDLDPSQYEIIIVDDGSTDYTPDVVEHMQESNDNITVLKQRNQGPAKARNYGASVAKGDILAFTDDDCLVKANWLSTIKKSFEDASVLALQGKTTTINELVTPLTHQVINENGDSSTPTCNAAYRKSVFIEAGGFDSGFPFQNEDTDLSWRVREQGTVKFTPEMHVLHPPREDSFVKNAKKMKHLISEFKLFYKNPGLYKKYRASSPWVTIYWLIMVKAQGYHFTRRIKYFRQPKLMFQGMWLSLVWWADLLRLLPTFMQYQQKYQFLYQRVHNHISISSTK